MITDIFRRVILGKKDKFIFKGYGKGMVDFREIDENTGIYIHIPFCKSICPYCPYNKVLYEKEKARDYKNSLMKEIKMYKKYLKNKNITSIYIGGGTPTLLVDELNEVISYIKDEFQFNGDIGIEVYPTEVSEELLTKLKSLGVNLLSLGVQTFDDDKLKFLGRRYTVKDIENALEKIDKFNFKCVDIDIMTNLPGQTIEDIEQDLRKVYSYNINQLSIYPLIVFPMTPMDKIIRENKLKRFSELEERKILNLIDKVSKECGYERSSIWTYGKSENNRYTSVTRESFIGIGAGASSLFSNYFYLNTFNVEEYIKALNEDKLPINIVNTMTNREKMIFWIFWRCYDGIIDKNRFYTLFNKDMKKEFRLLFNLLKIFGMSKEEEDKIYLTELGRFAYHYVEKQYSIYYLNNLWESSMKKAWIDEISL